MPGSPPCGAPRCQPLLHTHTHARALPSLHLLLCSTFTLNRERAVDYLNQLERLYGGCSVVSRVLLGWMVGGWADQGRPVDFE